MEGSGHDFQNHPPSAPPPSSQVSANIALRAFLIPPSDLLGLSCMALQLPQPSSDSDSSGERDAAAAADPSFLELRCHMVNGSGSPARQLSEVRLKTAWTL